MVAELWKLDRPTTLRWGRVTNNHQGEPEENSQYALVHKLERGRAFSEADIWLGYPTVINIGKQITICIIFFMMTIILVMIHY